MNGNILTTTNRAKVSGELAKIGLVFQGHYNEPDLLIDFPLAYVEEFPINVNMVFNPFKGKWELAMCYNGFTKEPTLPLEFVQAKGKK